MMIIIRRAQKPLVISVIGVLPPLTLQYYAAVSILNRIKLLGEENFDELN